VLKALYGGGRVKILMALRSPVDRFETAFWFHKQFWGAKGASADGLHALASQQVADFRECQAEHGPRKCAFLFERLGSKQGAAFWHANQVIRGLYLPFVSEWHAAFASSSDSLMVMMVEDLLDAPSVVHERIGTFLGLKSRSAYTPPLRQTYLQRHLASINVSCCGGGRGPPEPMHQRTRSLLDDFYVPFNSGLATLLRWPRLSSWRGVAWQSEDWELYEQQSRNGRPKQ
jgi:hypothetical protein